MPKLEDAEQYQTLLPFYDDIDVAHFKRVEYWKGFAWGCVSVISLIIFGSIYLHS